MRHQVEIPLTAWQTFAEEFSRAHDGERVSLFAQRGAGTLDPIARDVILRNFGCDIEPGQRSVVVTVDTSGERHMSHTISKPVVILFDGKTVNVRSELGSGFTIELARKEASYDTAQRLGIRPRQVRSKSEAVHR